MKMIKIILFFISVFSSFISLIYVVIWPYAISPFLSENTHLALLLTIIPLLGFLISIICAFWLGKSYIFNEINLVAENLADYLINDNNNHVD